MTHIVCNLSLFTVNLLNCKTLLIQKSYFLLHILGYYAMQLAGVFENNPDFSSDTPKWTSKRACLLRQWNINFTKSTNDPPSPPNEWCCRPINMTILNCPVQYISNRGLYPELVPGHNRSAPHPTPGISCGYDYRVPYKFNWCIPWVFVCIPIITHPNKIYFLLVLQLDKWG